jgi:hypothetical protein
MIAEHSKSSKNPRKVVPALLGVILASPDFQEQ